MDRRLTVARDRAARSFARSVAAWVTEDGHDDDWARAIVARGLFGCAPSTIAARNDLFAQAAAPVESPAANYPAPTEERQTMRIKRRVLDVGEVAAILSVHRNTARAMCERGRFDAAYQLPSGHWRIPRESVEPLTKRAA